MTILIEICSSEVKKHTGDHMHTDSVGDGHG